MNTVKEQVGSAYTSNSYFPSWFRFYLFLKQGLYRGEGKRIRWGRVLCWFDRHSFTHYYSINNLINLDNLEVKINCNCCGHQQKFNIGHNDITYLLLGRYMKPEHLEEIKTLLVKQKAV